MKKVFITGASSGIGKALAHAYAKRKCILGLSARREDILFNVADECRDLGGTPFVYQLDVQERNNCETVAEQFKKMRAVSIVLLPMLGLVVMMDFIQDQVRKLTPY